MTDRAPAETQRRRGATRGPLDARPRVRIPELVLGVLLVAGCALAAVLWQRSVSAGTTVLVAARPVPRGTVLGAGDLAPAEVRGADAITLLGVERAADLIGNVAVVDVPAGTPWSSGLVSAEPLLGPDDGLAAVAVGPGRAPPDLMPGDTVRVVLVGDDTASGERTVDLRTVAALVWGVRVDDQFTGDTLVTLRLPLSEAAVVAAADDVRLLRVEG